jgi:hypothetical protein
VKGMEAKPSRLKRTAVCLVVNTAAELKISGKKIRISNKG